MNEFEKRLREDGVKPRRPMSADFTSNTLALLDNGAPTRERRPKWKEYIQVKLIHKPALALLAFAITITIGGSAYAAVGGVSGIRALFGGQKQLEGGGRIVQIDTKDCPHVNAYNITNKNRTTSDSYYFRIKPDSKLTNDQVVAMIQANCDYDAEGVLNGASTALRDVELRPENLYKLVGGFGDSTITAIDKNGFTIQSSSAGDQSHRIITQTFTKLDPNLVVVQRGQTQSYGDLKVGDHISVTYRATGDALTNSETIAPDQIDASEQTVVSIIRVTPHPAAFYEYQKYNSVEFEQVIPCDKTASGYCNLEEYNK